MTLIASLINHNIPFLMSDLLMSSQIGDDNFESPSNNFPLKQYLPQHTQYKPDSLMQKSYILKNNLCISFAGEENEITDFLKEFKIQCRYYDNITKENIINILDSYDLKTKFKSSAFVIILVNEINNDVLNVGVITVPASKINWISEIENKGVWAKVETPIYGEVTACGSGRNGFLNIVSEKLKAISTFEKDHIWRAIQVNLMLIARMYALEKATLYTILSHWGGGFEAVMYDGKKFIKQQNVAFIINQGKFDDDGDVNLPIPTTILYYRYHDDFLLITGIHIKNTRHIDDGKLIKIIADYGNYEVKNVIVPRFDSASKTFNDDTFNYNFKTSVIAMGYDIRKSGNIGTFNPGSFTYHNEISASYTKNEIVEIVIAKEINTKFRKYAKEVYPNV